MSEEGKVLVEALGVQAAMEREEIARRAEAEAASPIAAAVSQAQAERGVALARLGRELAEMQERERGAVEAAMASLELAARRQLLEEVFTGAAHRLRLGGEAYATSLEILILAAAEALARAYPDRASGGLPLGRLQVRASDRDLALKVLERAGLHALIALCDEDGTETHPPGSVLLTSLDGRLVLDNGYASRLERARRQCSVDLAEVLFGGAGP